MRLLTVLPTCSRFRQQQGRHPPPAETIHPLPLAQVCYRLKQQLAGLMMLRETMKADSWPELAIEQPVIDVRIGQWLLSPESSAVKDSPEVEAAFRAVSLFRAGTFSKIFNLDVGALKVVQFQHANCSLEVEGKLPSTLGSQHSTLFYFLVSKIDYCMRTDIDGKSLNTFSNYPSLMGQWG